MKQHNQNQTTKAMKKEDIKIGLPVMYWSVIMADGEKLYPKKTVVRSEVWELGHGAEVCKVEGIAGGVSIKHLELIT